MLIEIISIFIVTIIFIWIIRHYAPKIGLMDTPNEPSTHLETIPRGAGIVLY